MARKERKERKEAVKNLKAQGKSNKQIAKLTGPLQAKPTEMSGSKTHQMVRQPKPTKSKKPDLKVVRRASRGSSDL
jgi:transposase